MGRLDGKVALVTGAARGQGRSHAVRLAEEGADIIAIDVQEHIDGVMYPLSTPEDMAETERLVTGLDRRFVSFKTDVRDDDAMRAAIDAGVAELGGLDVVAANAGISGNFGTVHELTRESWDLMLGIDLTGVWNTCRFAIPHMLDKGGSIAITSSAAGLHAIPGIGHYNSAKHGLVGLMRTMALELGQHRIRVNSIHPTQVDTPMLMNDYCYQLFRPDLEHPTREDIAEVSQSMHVLPVPWVDPVDISNAIVFLASDEGRYITGVTLPVDCGADLKA
jgi:(+)-trans-carveol dehydrogenase